MTLIIYAKYAHGVIVIADKKQNDELSNSGQSVRKYFLPRHHDYVVSLAGDGTRIDTITTPLEIEQTKADDIKKKLHDIVEVSRDPNMGISDGFLLVVNKTPREFYHVWTRVNKVGINHDDPLFECYGEPKSGHPQYTKNCSMHNPLTILSIHPAHPHHQNLFLMV